MQAIAPNHRDKKKICMYVLDLPRENGAKGEIIKRYFDSSDDVIEGFPCSPSA